MGAPDVVRRVLAAASYRENASVQWVGVAESGGDGGQRGSNGGMGGANEYQGPKGERRKAAATGRGVGDSLETDWRQASRI